jgi:hypothetical protein
VLACDRIGSAETATACAFGCDSATGDCSPAPTCPFPVTDLVEGDTRFNLCGEGNDHGNRRDRPSCPWSSADGPDRVFRLTLAARRSIFLELRDDDGRRYIDPLIYIRTSCDVASSQIACVDDLPSVQRPSFTVTLDAGIYYVFADSWDSFGGECGDVRLSYRIL